MGSVFPYISWEMDQRIPYCDRASAVRNLYEGMRRPHIAGTNRTNRLGSSRHCLGCPLHENPMDNGISPPDTCYERCIHFVCRFPWAAARDQCGKPLGLTGFDKFPKRQALYRLWSNVFRATMKCHCTDCRDRTRERTRSPQRNLWPGSRGHKCVQGVHCEVPYHRQPARQPAAFQRCFAEQEKASRRKAA
jgi:hypothetical protein